MEEKYLHAEERGDAKNLPFRTRRDLSSSLGNAERAMFDVNRHTGRQTFGKAEKLKSKKLIEKLFDEGKSVGNNGFTLVYLPAVLSGFYPVQAGFSVPKRFFKNATDRNYIKRQMREVWRKNKHELYTQLAAQNLQMAIMWVYKGKNVPGYSTTTEAMLLCLKKLPTS